jgi:hypothetical protein
MRITISVLLQVHELAVLFCPIASDPGTALARLNVISQNANQQGHFENKVSDSKDFTA